MSVDAIPRALHVYNLPPSVPEYTVRQIFPTATSVQLAHGQGDQSTSTCTLHFNDGQACQSVYTECQGGKSYEGRWLQAEYPREPHPNNASSYQASGNHQQSYGGYQMPQSMQPTGDNDKPFGSQASSCMLTISNLPYSASEAEIKAEFPSALSVEQLLDERGRARGVAQLTFSNPEECQRAVGSCNGKMLGGRELRGRVGEARSERPQNRSFNDNNSRGQYDNRSYGGGGDSRGFGRGGDRRGYGGGDDRGYGQQRRGYQGESNEGYGGRQSYGGGGGGRRDHDSYHNRNDRGGDRQYGGSNSGRFDRRGGGRQGGYGDYGRGGGRGGRRDRSPGRDEPVRGYGSTKSGGAGKRITSAVISRGGDDSSSASSDGY